MESVSTFASQKIEGSRVDDCRGASSVLARVGDKWSVRMVMLLTEGPRRFNELQRLTGDISHRMLTLTLRGLERDGLVKRTVTPTTPPRVDYELTPLGRSLSEPAAALGRWAMANMGRIEAARRSFDGAALAAGPAPRRAAG